MSNASASSMELNDLVFFDVNKLPIFCFLDALFNGRSNFVNEMSPLKPFYVFYLVRINYVLEVLSY